jgi:hypothetical protein
VKRGERLSKGKRQKQSVLAADPVQSNLLVIGGIALCVNMK